MQANNDKINAERDVNTKHVSLKQHISEIRKIISVQTYAASCDNRCIQECDWESEFKISF
jgi:hypothetical protein